MPLHDEAAALEAATEEGGRHDAQLVTGLSVHPGGQLQVRAIIVSILLVAAVCKISEVTGSRSDEGTPEGLSGEEGDRGRRGPGTGTGHR